VGRIDTLGVPRVWNTCLRLVYTSGFRMHFPHCVAIFHKLPWLSKTRVIYKKSQRSAVNECRNRMCKLSLRRFIFLNRFFAVNSRGSSFSMLRGHSNNTWHFLAYFRHTHTRVTWQFSFYRKHSFLKTFSVKFSSKIDKKMTRDISVDPPRPCVIWWHFREPPLRVSRIIWMAPYGQVVVVQTLFK